MVNKVKISRNVIHCLDLCEGSSLQIFLSAPLKKFITLFALTEFFCHYLAVRFSDFGFLITVDSVKTNNRT